MTSSGGKLHKQQLHIVWKIKVSSILDGGRVYGFPEVLNKCSGNVGANGHMFTICVCHIIAFDTVSTSVIESPIS